MRINTGFIKMRKILSVLALTSISALALANPESFEFKGAVLGSNLADFESNPKYSCMNPNRPLVADKVCMLDSNNKETIAGAPISSLMFMFYSEKLSAISITLEEKYYSQVVGALTEKYGQGGHKSETIRNRMGTSFENNIYTWIKPDGMLTATRYSGKLDTSKILYNSAKSMEEYRNRRGTSSKDQAKDL
jgi:hypothetical protein